MNKYVSSLNQLIVELYARNLRVPCAFYQQPGFQLVREDGDFWVRQSYGLLKTARMACAISRSLDPTGWACVSPLACNSPLPPREPLQILRGQRVQTMNHLQVIKA